MHSKDRLAAALTEVGLHEMAAKAAEGYYHDYLSPLDLPEMTLVDDLMIAAKNTRDDRAQAIFDVRNRVVIGEFDATSEESDEWANSPEGQEIMSWLKTKSSRS